MADQPPDLITLDYCRGELAQLNPSPAQMQLVPTLITAASNAVRRWCLDRNFDLRTYVEFQDVALNGQIRLWQVPVQIIQRVQGAPVVALTVTNNSTIVQAAQAYFAFTGTWQGYGNNAQVVTGITLSSVSSGTATTTTVTYTANETIATLAAAINGVGGGWNALSTSGIDQWPATELDGGYVAQGCAGGAVPSAGAQFQILQDLAIGNFRLDTNRMGILAVGRQYGYSASEQWGPGGSSMFNGSGGWLGRVKITYQAGEAVIPYPVQLATAELVKNELLRAKTDDMLKSENAQEYSYQLTDKAFMALPPHVLQGLSAYRLPRA